MTMQRIRKMSARPDFTAVLLAGALAATAVQGKGLSCSPTAIYGHWQIIVDGFMTCAVTVAHHGSVSSTCSAAIPQSGTPVVAPITGTLAISSGCKVTGALTWQMAGYDISQVQVNAWMATDGSRVDGWFTYTTPANWQGQQIRFGLIEGN